ncbi:MAG: CtpF protein [Alphaproteobacteria bacterium]|nr:MAG: CtpF protein [Alphaproteobacteria bacterium]
MNDPAYARPAPDQARDGIAEDPAPVPELPIPSAPVPDPAAGSGQGEPLAPMEPPVHEPVRPAAAPAPMPAPDAPAAAVPGHPSGAGPAPMPAQPMAQNAPVSGQTPQPASTARPIPRINIQAFCENPATAQILQNASQDRRLSKAHVTVQMGGIDAAVAFYRNAPTPNLIIVESLHRPEPMLADLNRLAEVCDPATKVIVIGHVNDVFLYRELIHNGVSEYLVMPFGVAQVMECISSLYTDPEAEPLGQVIAFIGAKGGAGSSTVCHNVAWAISEAIESDVVIADFDLPFGTAGLDFNQDPVQGIADALSAPERVDDVLLDRLLSRCSDHLSLFAAPGTLDRAYDLTSGACDTVIEVLRRNVPYIAVDLPHLWTDWARQVATEADQIVITASPDLASLRNTKNLIEKLSAARPNDNPPYLVLNQVGVAKRPEISVKDFSSALEAEVRFVIEFDAQLFGTAANNGQMIEEVSAKSKAAEKFRELAMVLTERSEEKMERSSSLLAPILSRLNLKKAGK